MCVKKSRTVYSRFINYIIRLPNQTMIKITSLRVDYEDISAVKDLNLEILAGQIYGLVGPNGAGKTSLIKAIAGIIEPTYGEIKINDVDMELQQERALQFIGYMPDFSPVYENLYVWEYLDVFATAYQIPQQTRREKIEYWIKRVNLEEKTNTFIKDLSRGMRQRLVLAKTLLHDPSVLLLDEPASGLDPLARKELHDILKTVAMENKAILISSHILSELSDFCNAIGIMEKGNLITSGTLEEIRKRTQTKGHIIISLIGQTDELSQKLTDFLKTFSYISNVQRTPRNEWQLDFSGSSQDASFVLKRLIEQGFPVFNFYLKEANVEDIFFKVGANKVS